jgi:hypothetical protein
MDLDLSTFEPFMGETPYRVISRHAHDQFVAFQVMAEHPQTGHRREFSALWDSSTGKIVWAPEYTIAMAWRPDGNQIGMLRERYDYNPSAHQIIGSPLQSEFTYTWERRSWPEKTLISACRIQMPTGWPDTLAISPRHNLAVFQWFDQEESGLEFITLTDEGDFQLQDAGLPFSASVRPICLRKNGNGYPIGSSLATTPTISLDGRYIVFGWQDKWVWWADLAPNQYLKDDTPSRVGLCQVGKVEIIDWDERRVRTIDVMVDLPVGWKPPFLDTPKELLYDPQFIDNEHFTLHLPTGEIRTYSVKEN